jgi:hypothetical protein
VFPNEASLLRLVSAALMKLSEEPPACRDWWETGKRCLNMDVQNNDSASGRKKIYKKRLHKLRTFCSLL